MQRIPEKTGDIIDIDSKKKVGKHKGIYFYTMAKRWFRYRRSRIAYYVVDKDIAKNILYVGHGNNHPAMFKSEVELEIYI